MSSNVQAWRHPATWIALMALVVALSGSAYAASKIDGKDLKKRSVAGNRLEPGAVTGGEVGDGSLTAADLAPGTIPTVVPSTPTTPAPTTIQPGSIQLTDLSAAARVTLAETVPPGARLVGTATLHGVAGPVDDTYNTPVGTIDYGGRTMPSAMHVDFVGLNGSPTAHCPGSATAPDAAPGYLCIYVTFASNLTQVNVAAPENFSGGASYLFGPGQTSGSGTIGRYGAYLVTQAQDNPGPKHSLFLMWAARAATS